MNTIIASPVLSRGAQRARLWSGKLFAHSVRLLVGAAFVLVEWGLRTGREKVAASD